MNFQLSPITSSLTIGYSRMYRKKAATATAQIPASTRDKEKDHIGIIFSWQRYKNSEESSPLLRS